MATRLKTNDDGYYWNYHTSVFIGHNAHQDFSTLNNWKIKGTFTSNDSGQPGTGSVTIYNVAPQHMHAMKIKEPISIWTGPPKLFGRLCLGEITKVTQGFDDKDRTVTLNFSESAGYENQQTVKLYNGAKTIITKHTTKGTAPHRLKSGKMSKGTPSKTTTHKKVQKAKWVAKTFNRGIKAKQIIQWISKKCKIRISRLKLKNNKSYKRGYRLSQRPLQAIQSLANDCGSKVYYRGSNLIIDDGNDNNPFHEHLVLGIGYGLLQQPTINQREQKNKKGKITALGTHSFTALEDPRVLAGSNIFFDPQTVKGMTNNLYTVKSITHQFSNDGYQMSGVVYG